MRPGLAFLAESDDPALLRSAFDIDYAWDFYHAMSDALAGRKPASFVREVWQRAEPKYPRGALRLRFSDNHDQLRATGQAGLPAALAASAVMFTLDGVPLLYNGMEVGDTVESAAPALFERAPIQWEMAERRPQVTPYYQALAALRRAHPAFTRGAVRWLTQWRRAARAELRAQRRAANRSWWWSTCRRSLTPAWSDADRDVLVTSRRPSCSAHAPARAAPRVHRDAAVHSWRPGNSGFSGRANAVNTYA